MAVARIRSRTSGMTVRLDWDGVDRTVKAFRDVRRDLSRELTELERDVGERVVLPWVRLKAGHLKVDGRSVADTLAVRRRRSAPYITTTMRGLRGRAVGLQEFGGTVRTPIRPRRAKALAINGNVRAVVTTARHYRAARFMQDGVAASQHAFGSEVRDEIVDRFFRPHFEIT